MALNRKSMIIVAWMNNYTGSECVVFALRGDSPVMDQQSWIRGERIWAGGQMHVTDPFNKMFLFFYMKVPKKNNACSQFFYSVSQSTPGVFLVIVNSQPADLHQYNSPLLSLINTIEAQLRCETQSQLSSVDISFNSLCPAERGTQGTDPSP